MQHSTPVSPKNNTNRTHRPATAAAKEFALDISRKTTGKQQTKQQHLGDGTEPSAHEQAVGQLVQRVEERLVAATWTLRRTPDRERGFLHMRTMMWPDTAAEAGTYAPPAMTALQARRNVRLSPQEIDQMQPALDLLQLLPDPADRKLVFWACWHQDGEVQVKVPWAKVRRSMDSAQSRWTMKRRYANSLRWLASIILAQGQ